MNASVDSIISGLQDEIVSAVRETIRMRSVRAPEAGPGAPFGEELARCLDSVLSLAKSMGFSVKNLNGYAGVVDYDCGCKETLGVLCHLDVVPAGNGWIHDPFGAQMEGGRIYGRGALDDKGPTLSSLYALFAVKQAGVSLHRNVRIILGCDEETSWECIEYYKAEEPLPDIAFSPDANYPLIWSEKNVLQATYAKRFSSRIEVDAGTMPNVVPGEAFCRVPLPPESIVAAASLIEAETGCSIALCADGKGARIAVKGAFAHASCPEMGNNASTALLSLLAKLPLGSDSDMANALAERFCDLNGTRIGIDCADETGRTTMNLGILRWNEAGIERLTLDARFPFSLSMDEAERALDGALLPLGFSSLRTYKKEIHKVPRDSELVTKLLDIYERRTLSRLEPIFSGSITYARAVKNAVAFGCARPGREECIHRPEEHIAVEDLMFNAYMIADAILALAGEG